MKLLYKGKTKDVYKLDENRVVLKFKDDVTGKDGKFDPGANKVALSMEGAGESALKLSSFFFEKLNHLNIPTHFISSDKEKGTMTVLKAEDFGQGLEVICRYKAVGSFLRRYGLYVDEGDTLDAYVEFTLKDDKREDPLITKQGLLALGIMEEDEYNKVGKLTREICSLVKKELEEKGLELYDIKLEFGKVGEDGSIVLIDEISGGNMRVFKDGEYVEPLELAKYF